jgi:hypothetical protein
MVCAPLHPIQAGDSAELFKANNFTAGCHDQLNAGDNVVRESWSAPLTNEMAPLLRLAQPNLPVMKVAPNAIEACALREWVLTCKVCSNSLFAQVSNLGIKVEGGPQAHIGSASRAKALAPPETLWMALPGSDYPAANLLSPICALYRAIRAQLLPPNWFVSRVLCCRCTAGPPHFCSLGRTRSNKH